MNIGILALAFALVCSPLALYGMMQPSEDKPAQKTDYSSIYKALAPKEL